MSTVKRPGLSAASTSNSSDPLPDGSEGGQVCIANINAKGRRRRLNFAIMGFNFGFAMLVLLMMAGVDHRWRLGLFFVFAGAATSYFEWRDKTCVALAAQNIQEVDDGYARINDKAINSQIRRQAIRLQIKAILLGAALTLIAILLP